VIFFISVGHWFRTASFSHEFCFIVLLCNLHALFLLVGYNHPHVDGEGRNFPQSKKMHGYDHACILLVILRMVVSMHVMPTSLRFQKWCGALEYKSVDGKIVSSDNLGQHTVPTYEQLIPKKMK
jgi:hypothetical protein